MKYNVGDKVIIRDDLIPGSRYGRVKFNSFGYMNHWRGKTMTIKYIDQDEYIKYYMVEDNKSGDSWTWSEDMISHKYEEPIVIPIDKKNTVRRINLRA